MFFDAELSNMSNIQFLSAPIDSLVEFPPLPRSDLTWKPLSVEILGSKEKTQTQQALFRANAAKIDRGSTDLVSGENKLFVFGISPNMNSMQITNEFSHFGSVTKVWNSGKGYAFVSFQDRQDCVNAIQGLDGSKIWQKPIQVSFAKKKAKGKSPVLKVKKKKRGAVNQGCNTDTGWIIVNSGIDASASFVKKSTVVLKNRFDPLMSLDIDYDEGVTDLQNDVPEVRKDDNPRNALHKKEKRNKNFTASSILNPLAHYEGINEPIGSTSESSSFPTFKSGGGTDKGFTFSTKDNESSEMLKHELDELLSNAVLSNAVGDFVSISSYILDKNDIKSLFFDNYVTDGALNFLLNLFCDSLSSEDYEFIVVGTDLIKALENNSRALASELFHKWCEPKNLDKIPIYILPVCQNCHWVLGVLYERKGFYQSYIYDPLAIKPRISVESVLKQFSDLCGISPELYPPTKYLNGPVQRDSVNCGIYLFCFAKILLKSRTGSPMPKDYSFIVIEDERVKIIQDMAILFEFDETYALYLHQAFLKSKENIKSSAPSIQLPASNMDPKSNTPKVEALASSAKNNISFDSLGSNTNDVTSANNSGINERMKSIPTKWSFTKNSNNDLKPSMQVPILTPVLNKFHVLGVETPVSSKDYLPLHVNVSPLKDLNERNKLQATNIVFSTGKSEEMQNIASVQSFGSNLPKDSPLKTPKFVYPSPQNNPSEAIFQLPGMDESGKRKAGTPLKSHPQRPRIDETIPDPENCCSRRNLFSSNTDEDDHFSIEERVTSKNTLLSLPIQIESLTNIVVYKLFQKIVENTITLDDFINFLCKKCNLSSYENEFSKVIGIDDAFINLFLQKFQDGCFLGCEFQLFDKLSISSLMKQIIDLHSLETENKKLKRMIYENSIERVKEEMVPSSFIANCAVDGVLKNCFYGKEYINGGRRVIYSVFMKVHTFTRPMVTNKVVKDEKTIKKRGRQIKELMLIYGGKLEDSPPATERLLEGFVKDQKESLKTTIESGNIKDLKLAKKLNVEQSAYLLSEIGGAHNVLRKMRIIFRNAGVPCPFESEHKIRQFNKSLLEQIIPLQNCEWGRLNLIESGGASCKNLDYWKVIDLGQFVKDYFKKFIMDIEGNAVKFQNIFKSYGEILLLVSADHGGNITIDGASTQKYCLQFYHFQIVEYCMFKGSDTYKNQQRVIAGYYEQFVELIKNGFHFEGICYPVRIIDKGDMKQSNLTVGLGSNAGVYPCRHDMVTSQYLRQKCSPLILGEQPDFELRTVEGTNYNFHMNFLTSKGNEKKMRDDQKMFKNITQLGIYPVKHIHDLSIDLLHAKFPLIKTPIDEVIAYFRQSIPDIEKRTELSSMEQILENFEQHMKRIDKQKIEISENVVYFREKITRMQIISGSHKIYKTIEQYVTELYGSRKIGDKQFGKWDIEYNCPKCLFCKHDTNAIFRPCPVCNVARHPYCCEDSDLKNIGKYEENLPCMVCVPPDHGKRIKTLENHIEAQNVAHFKLTKETNDLGVRTLKINQKIENFKTKEERLLDKKLEEIGVRRTAFRGGQLIGAHCDKILEHREDIVKVFPSHLQDSYLEYLTVVDNIVLNCSSTQVYSPEKIANIKEMLAKLGQLYPVLFRKVTPKVYDLVIHLGRFMDRNKSVGMFNSEDLERVHRIFNMIFHKLANVKGPIKYLYASQKFYLKVLLRNRNTGLSTPPKRNFKTNVNDLNQNSLSDEFGIDDSCFNDDHIVDINNLDDGEINNDRNEDCN